MPTYSFSRPRAPTLRGMGTALRGALWPHGAPRSNPQLSPPAQQSVRKPPHHRFPPPLRKLAGHRRFRPAGCDNGVAAYLRHRASPDSASGDTGSRARCPGTKREARSKPWSTPRTRSREQLQAAATLFPCRRPVQLHGDRQVLGDLRSELVSGGVPLSCLSCPPRLLGKPLPHRKPSWLGHMWDAESKCPSVPPGKEAPGAGTEAALEGHTLCRPKARFTPATGPGSDS